MKKKVCINANIILLLWFFLNMTGLYFGDKYLVTTSFREEWPFMIIPLAALIVFIVKDNIGKPLLAGWLSMWFITQFLSHEWYTIFGSGFLGDIEGKICYFEDSIKLIQSDTAYIPDLYHIVLHILILIALYTTLRYHPNRQSHEVSTANQKNT